MMVDGGAWVVALLLGAVVVVVAWTTTGENVDAAFSGFLWAPLLFGVVAGVVWGFGAWVVG